MLLLYLIGILCSVVLFAPSIVPSYIKWPVALLVALLIVFIFNLPKKDTIYATHDNKKKVLNYGLFNPLIMYLAASIYILGFTLIFTHLNTIGINDIVLEFPKIIESFSFDLKNYLFCGFIFVVLAAVIYFIRNGFKNNASESSLKFRSFWYVVFTVICLLIGVFNFDSFYTFDIYDHILSGYNVYVYFGLLGLIILIDLLGKLISHRKKVRRERRALEAETTPEPIPSETLVEEESVNEVVEPQLSKKEQRRLEKRERIIAKEKARMERKIAKEQAKIDKALAKIKEEVEASESEGTE